MKISIMTREEFKQLVHRNQRFERFFGYVFFLSPLVFSLWLLGVMVVHYINDPFTFFLVGFALVITGLCALFAWWGVRRIKRSYKTVIVIHFNSSKITPNELIKLIADKLEYRKLEKDSGLLLLINSGWRPHEVFVGSSTDEIYVDLRIFSNDGFSTWGLKKTKKWFVDKLSALEQEVSFGIVLEMDVENKAE